MVRVVVDGRRERVHLWTRGELEVAWLDLQIISSCGNLVILQVVDKPKSNESLVRVLALCATGSFFVVYPKRRAKTFIIVFPTHNIALFCHRTRPQQACSRYMGFVRDRLNAVPD